MGCDIHAAIEFKQDGKWTALMLPNKWHGREGWEDEPEQSAQLDFGRNYDAFAVLANVRNGRGFAGIETGSGFKYISDQRGLPEDISEAGRKACSGDHSETWVGLKEILDFDWTQTTVQYGVINAVEFEEWDRLKEWEPGPKSYCGDVDGQSIVKISENEMRALVGSIVKRGADYDRTMETLQKEHGNKFCRISWVEPYVKSVGQLWKKFVPIMLKLANEHGGPENVRMVMNFDS